MEVITHAESIVEWFLWTIEHTNRSLDIQCNVSPITGFIRHTIIVCLMKPVMDETLLALCDGQNVALNIK